MREELGRLSAHELRERSVRGLVALDLELREHRVGAGKRRQQVRDARHQHAQLADANAALARHLGADGGDQDDRATAGHVQVGIVQVEDGDRHAARGEDRVVGEARVEDVAEDVVGPGRRHACDHGPQRLARLSVRRAAEPVLHHGPGVLVGRKRVETGPERGADRERHGGRAIEGRVRSGKACWRRAASAPDRSTRRRWSLSPCPCRSAGAPGPRAPARPPRR